MHKLSGICVSVLFMIYLSINSAFRYCPSVHIQEVFACSGFVLSMAVGVQTTAFALRTKSLYLVIVLLSGEVFLIFLDFTNLLLI